jgi:hypothetical protein
MLGNLVPSELEKMLIEPAVFEYKDLPQLFHETEISSSLVRFLNIFLNQTVLTYNV